jgi:rhodanese-related sulfurtransferase
LRSRLDELDREKTYIIYCAAGLRGYIAARMMIQNGFGKVKNLAGGFNTWLPANWKKEESGRG